MKKGLIIICIALTQKVHSQQLFDTISISNVIIKNVISYQIYEDIIKNGQSIKSYGYASYFSNLNNPIPDPGIEYKIVFKKTDIKLDTLSYDIYEFNITDLSNRNKVLKCSKDSIVIWAKNSIIKNPLSYKGLVAIKKDQVSASNIIFLSGRMFLDDIKPYVLKSNEKTLKDYTMMRFFNFGPEIKQVNLAKSEVIFYSTVLKKKYKLIVQPEIDQLLDK